ncbi:MAG: hypothetical protein VX237_02225, partial [Chloroflexota bacterium]|nr:hypothetical protein [Chloroflexota bacterium]
VMTSAFRSAALIDASDTPSVPTLLNAMSLSPSLVVSNPSTIYTSSYRALVFVIGYSAKAI